MRLRLRRSPPCCPLFSRSLRFSSFDFFLGRVFWLMVERSIFPITLMPGALFCSLFSVKIAGLPLSVSAVSAFSAGVSTFSLSALGALTACPCFFSPISFADAAGCAAWVLASLAGCSFCSVLVSAFSTGVVCMVSAFTSGFCSTVSTFCLGVSTFSTFSCFSAETLSALLETSPTAAGLVSSLSS